MRKFTALGLVLLIVISLVPIAAQDAIDCMTDDNATVVVTAGTDSRELALTETAIEQFMAACPNIAVEMYQDRNLASDRIGVYHRLLNEQSTVVDIYMVNITSVGDLAEHLVDLTPYAGNTIDDHFTTIIENNIVDGELKAIPWSADAGVLYYRIDLLDKYGFDNPPITWNDLTEMAQVIQDGERASGNNNFWGYVWQGNNYEGLTSNALEWQWSESATRIATNAGEIEVSDPAFIAALERAARWVGTISPADVTSYEEEDARSVFTLSNAAFMRDWIGFIGQAEDSRITGMFGVTSLPFGEAGENGATLSGWQLAVSKYSENTDAAAAVAIFLTNFENQKERVIAGISTPSIVPLYEDRDVLNAFPTLGELADVIQSGVARPSTIAGSRYDQVSAEYYTAIHNVLVGDEDAAIAMELLSLYLGDIIK